MNLDVLRYDAAQARHLREVNHRLQQMLWAAVVCQPNQLEHLRLAAQNSAAGLALRNLAIESENTRLAQERDIALAERADLQQIAHEYDAQILGLWEARDRLTQAHTAALAENARLKAENDTLVLGVERRDRAAGVNQLDEGDWTAKHTDRGHAVKKFNDGSFLECSCGATFWPS